MSFHAGAKRPPPPLSSTTSPSSAMQEDGPSAIKKARSWLWPLWSSPSGVEKPRTVAESPLEVEKVEAQEMERGEFPRIPESVDRVFAEPWPVKKTSTSTLLNPTNGNGSSFFATHSTTSFGATATPVKFQPPVERSYSPMSLSSRTPSAMSTTSSTESSYIRKRTSGFRILDKYREEKKKEAIKFIIKTNVPDYQEASRGGYRGTEKDYKELVSYAKMVYRQTITPTKDKIPPRQIHKEPPRSREQSVTSIQGHEVPWLKALRERIERTLRAPFEEIDEKVETPTYDRLIASQKALDEQIELIQKKKTAKRDNFPPLGAHVEAKISQMMAPGKGTIVSAFNVDIQKHDVQTLCNGKWLNDEVINFYSQLIMKRCKARQEVFADVHVYNTFFYDTLSKSGYSKVRKWSKKFDTFQKAVIIIPVHLGMHWVCAAINFKRKRFEYYDSLHGSAGKAFSILRKYLEEESRDKKKEDIDLSGWTDYCPKNIPAQQNGYDCGVFTCMFMDYLARDEDFDFSQEHMPYLRRRIVWEISQAKLTISE